MTEINGISSSPGYSIGRAFVYRHDKLVILHEHIPELSVNDEIERLDGCFSSLISEYREYLEHATGDSERALYSVELLMLDDVEYRKSIKKLISEKLYSQKAAQNNNQNASSEQNNNTNTETTTAEEENTDNK